MSKVTLPALAIGASGSITKDYHYRKTRSGTSACVSTTPANPQSILQISHRNLFKLFSHIWRDIKPYPPDLVAWLLKSRTSGGGPTPYHQFMYDYMHNYEPILYYGFIRNLVITDAHVHDENEGSPPPCYNLYFTIDYDSYAPHGALELKFCLGINPRTALQSYSEPIEGWTWSHYHHADIILPWEDDHFYFWAEPHPLGVPGRGIASTGIYLVSDIPYD